MEGYSADNYIIDQDFFGDYTYRTIRASRNGCGPIAAFNLLKYLGREKPLEEIISEMDSMYRVKAPGPTTMKVMRSFLRNHLPEVIESRGKDSCLRCMAESRCGIIRYNESGVPHFVSYFREGENYRFFNVETGFEDWSAGIEEFSGRMLPGYTASFTIR